MGINRIVSRAFRLYGPVFKTAFGALTLGALLYFAYLADSASWRLGIVDDLFLYTFICLAPTKYWSGRPAAIDSIWRIAFGGFICALLADWYVVNHSFAHCGTPGARATAALFIWLPLLVANYLLFRRAAVRDG